jgi:hypothetical protein
MVMGTISKKSAYITSGLRTNVRASLVIAVELVLQVEFFDTYSVLQGIDKVSRRLRSGSAKTRTNC